MNGTIQTKNLYLSKAKTLRVSVFLAPEDSSLLDSSWKLRSYPDPYNSNRLISFKSRQQYLEFVIRALNKLGSTGWYFFRHFLNPDFPVG